MNRRIEVYCLSISTNMKSQIRFNLILQQSQIKIKREFQIIFSCSSNNINYIKYSSILTKLMKMHQQKSNKLYTKLQHKSYIIKSFVLV